MSRHLAVLLIAVLAILGLAARSHAQGVEVTGFEFAIREADGVPNEISDPELFLYIETYEDFSCWRIPVETSVEGSVIRLDLSDPVPPPPGTGCAAILFPARFEEQIDLAPGEYDLSLTWRDRTDAYDLKVTDAYTELTATDATFTSPRLNTQYGPHPIEAVYAVPGHSRWYRFPPQSFTVTCGSIADDAFCRSFIDRLEALDVSRIELPADGIPPYTDQNGYYFNKPTLLYGYDTDASWLAAGTSLQEYIDTVDNTCGRGIGLENWRNDFAYSWLMREADCGNSEPDPQLQLEDPVPNRSDEIASAQASEPDGSDGGATNWLLWGIAGVAGIAAVAAAGVSLTRDKKDKS